MKTLKFVGGPGPFDAQLIDPETGKIIPGVKSIEIRSFAGEFVTASVEMIVSADVEIDVENITISEIIDINKLGAPV
jgi:hypothetical protein